MWVQLHLIHTVETLLDTIKWANREISNIQLEVQLESSHPIENSASINSPSREFDYIEVTNNESSVTFKSLCKKFSYNQVTKINREFSFNQITL